MTCKGHPVRHPLSLNLRRARSRSAGARRSPEGEDGQHSRCSPLMIFGRAFRLSSSPLACALQKSFADFTRGAARCFDCSREVGVVLTATWSLVRSHSKRRPLSVRTGGGFRFFRVSGQRARLAGAASSSRANSVRGTMQKKDRLAAVSPKSDQVFRSGGCECGGALPFPALAQEKGPSMTPGPIAILEVASSGPSAVPQSGTN